MNKMMKKSLVAAICSLAFLPLVGCGNAKMTAEAYTATAPVTAVDIDVDRANITLKVADGETKVEYEESEKLKFRVLESGGVLRITEKDLPWYKEVFKGTDVAEIVVYLPATLEYIFAETDRGFVKCEGFTADGIELSSDRGKITATDLTAKEAEFSSDRGSVNATRIDVSAALELSTDRGDITASIRGSQADFKTEVEKGRGSSNVSSTSTGAKRLDIETDRGDIRVSFYS